MLRIEIHEYPDPPRSQRVFPQLASYVKASYTKVLCAYLAHFTYALPAPDESSRLRAVATWAHAGFHHVLDNAGAILSDSEASEAAHMGRVFLVAYQKLAWLARTDGVYLWKIRPKHHLLDHMIDGLARDKLNPRRLSCMIDECYLGKMKKSSLKCHRSCVSLRFLQRCLLYMGLRWEDRRQLMAL